VLLASLVLGTTQAHAHAILVSTDPPANARLTRAPARVRLVFNEPVEPVFNSIRVFDASRRRYDSGRVHVGGDPSVVEVPLRALGPGPYTVLWRVTSIDGHQIRGSFGFGVDSSPPDEAAISAAAAAPPSRGWMIYVGIVRLIGLISLTMWLGGLMFMILVSLPATASFGNVAVPSFSRPSAGAGATFLLAETVGFLNQAAALADVSLMEVLSSAVIGTVIVNTNFGLWWSVRMVSATLLFAWSLRGFATRQDMDISRQPGTWGALGTLGGVLLVTFPLTGHARGGGPGMVAAVVSDWIHLAATVTWLGGLFAFTRGLWHLTRARSEQPAIIAAVATRFSRLALICVALLVLSGLYNTWLYIPTFTALWTTTYGRVLLAKLIVILPVLAVASVNLRRIVPHLRAARNIAAALQQSVRRLRAFVTAESALAPAILALATVLTTLPPATTGISGAAFSATASHGDVRVTLTVEPNKAGPNLARVILNPYQRTEASRVRRVTLYVRCLDMDMGVQTFETTADADGSRRARITVPMIGRTQVSVEIEPERADTYVVPFTMYSGS
jgi:copper transport protein